MKKYLLLVGAVIIIAIAGRAYWAYQQVKNDELKVITTPVLTTTESTQTIAVAPTASVAPSIVNTPTLKTSPTTDTTGWITYTDPKYKFSIQYPRAMTNIGDWYPSSPIGMTFTVALHMDNSNQTVGFLTINQIRNSALAVDYCSNLGKLFPQNSGNTLLDRSVVSINSTSFTRSNFLSNSGVKGLERHYTVLHEGICYDIEVTSQTAPQNISGLLTGSSGGSQSLPQNQDYRATLNKLDEIAQTFRFN